MLFSCASMFSDRVKNIPVTTNPDNANISVYSASGGKIFQGKSPCTISFDKSQLLNAKVLISLKGYKDTEVLLGNTIEPWAIANGCFFIMPGFIIGGGIDFLNGNLNKPEVENINVFLEPVSEDKITSETSESEPAVVHMKVYENNGTCTLLISEK